MAETRTLLTAEQVPRTSEHRRSELVRGELIERMPVSRGHGRIAGRWLAWLGAFVAERGLGEVGTEVGFILARDPDIVRAPDVHFVASARFAGCPDEGFFPGPPDLAVEVLSPDDRAAKVQEKVREYLAAGTGLVWVVDPRAETVTAYVTTGEARLYAGDAEVAGDPVLPGFSFRSSALFRG